MNCFLLTNLAVADMLMGVYLLTIAILLWTSGGKGSTLSMTRNGDLDWVVKLLEFFRCCLVKYLY